MVPGSDSDLAINSSLGRVLHVRQFGSKFFFVKVVENGKMLQAQVNFGKLKDGTELQDFKQLTKLIARGDHICKSSEGYQ